MGNLLYNNVQQNNIEQNKRHCRGLITDDDFILKTSEYETKIPIKNIKYLEDANDRIYLHLRSGEKFELLTRDFNHKSLVDSLVTSFREKKSLMKL
jgi:hypothetical protein